MSDRPMRILPYLYILPGSITRNHMDVLVKFEGDVKYAKLYIPEVQENIPDDLRWSVCSKSESKASPLEGLYNEK